MKADWGSADTGGCGGEERRAPRGAGEWGSAHLAESTAGPPGVPVVSGLLLTSRRQESLPHREGGRSGGVGGSGQRVRTVCLPPRAARGAM